MDAFRAYHSWKMERMKTLKSMRAGAFRKISEEAPDFTRFSRLMKTARTQSSRRIINHYAIAIRGVFVAVAIHLVVNKRIRFLTCSSRIVGNVWQQSMFI